MCGRKTGTRGSAAANPAKVTWTGTSPGPVFEAIDFFCDASLAFQVMAHKSHKGEITDGFAGRLYPAHQRSEAVPTMRQMLTRVRTLQPEPVA